MKASIVLLCSFAVCLLDGATAIRPSSFGLSKNIDRSRSSVSKFHISSDDGDIFSTSRITTVPRGGACSDSPPALFAKVALGATVETLLMYATLIAAKSEKVLDLPSTTTRVIQSCLIFCIIFLSSTYGAIADMGLSAATKQLLMPNEIPVSI